MGILKEANLDTNQLQELLRKGLEKDIITYVSNHLIAISREQIEKEIREHVTTVVRGYTNSIVSLNRDIDSGNIVINIQFITPDMIPYKSNK